MLTATVALAVALSFSGKALAEACRRSDTSAGESVVLHEVLEAPKPTRRYTEEEQRTIAAVKRQLVEFWKGAFEARYRMFTEEYKERLKRLGLRGPSDLGALFDAESYSCLTFREVDHQRVRGDEVILIKVDMDWSREGYDGTRTFIFTFVREKGQWKIDAIVN